MSKLRVYADTSVFGGTDDEEFQTVCLYFFEQVRQGRYIVVVSDITLDELDGAPGKIKRVFEQLPDGTMEEVSVTTEINDLAQKYIDAQVLGETNRADALHVATATVTRTDILLSCNFRHIVNYNRIHKFNGVNALNGYPQIEIHSPLEMYDGDENKNV